MNNKASITSLMSAFTRAYHNESCEYPVFQDDMARRLMTDEEYQQIKGYIKNGIDFFAPERKNSFLNEDEMLDWIVNTQLAPTPLARARYCEDSLKTAILTGTTQYVILGAGLDTFAWRERELMSRIDVFEADHPMTQEDKKIRIDRAGLDIPDKLHFVPVDFSCDELKSQLLKSGFDPSKKTFFSWLGVSYYLTEKQITRLLESIESFAAEGSTLLFDYADEGLFTAGEKRVQNMLALAATGGEDMRFCADEMEITLLLEKYHFLIYEVMTPDDIQNSYYSGFTNGLSAFEHISYILAVIKGTHEINTKEKILQTSLRLFAKNGYDAVSVKDIADCLLITKGALYRHYKSKRDIFDSIIQRMKDFQKENAESALDSQDCNVNRKIKIYLENEFHRWIGDVFASECRKMLELERYKNAEAAGIYNRYFIYDPIQYIAKLLKSENKAEDDPETLALKIYSPVYTLYSLYDGTTECRNDAVKKFKEYTDSFTEQE